MLLSQPKIVETITRLSVYGSFCRGTWHTLGRAKGGTHGYYVAYKSITLLCILFMFIEIKFIYCHSCMIFAMKSMSMCNE